MHIGFLVFIPTYLSTVYKVQDKVERLWCLEGEMEPHKEGMS